MCLHSLRVCTYTAWGAPHCIIDGPQGEMKVWIVAAGGGWSGWRQISECLDAFGRPAMHWHPLLRTAIGYYRIQCWQVRPLEGRGLNRRRTEQGSGPTLMWHLLGRLWRNWWCGIVDWGKQYNIIHHIKTPELQKTGDLLKEKRKLMRKNILQNLQCMQVSFKEYENNVKHLQRSSYSPDLKSTGHPILV